MRSFWVFFLAIMASVAAYNDAYLSCGFLTCGILLAVSE